MEENKLKSTIENNIAKKFYVQYMYNFKTVEKNVNKIKGTIDELLIISQFP